MLSASSRPTVMRSSAARRTTTVRAQATQKPNLAQAVVAVIATAVIAAAPVFAEPDTKQAVCASNPTAKICLKGSFVKK